MITIVIPGILETIKKMLTIEKDQTNFDSDIISYINTSLLALNQIGVGPKHIFCITGYDETWLDFFGDRKDLDASKTLIYMKVRLVFDPPQTSTVLQAYKEEIIELESRLRDQVESTEGVVISA